MDATAVYCALLRRDFVFFLRHVFLVLGGVDPYVHGWHIDAMVYELSLLESGASRRTIISMPPRHLKSITVTIAWVAWMILRNPALRIFVISYGADLVEDQGRETLKIFKDPMVRRAFPGFRLTKRTDANIQTDCGGWRKGRSLGGAITGQGADYIVIDDPTKSQDAVSEAIRDSDKKWLMGTAMTRFNNAATGRLVVVMQRLHDYDLVGVLREIGDWRELCLPAIAQEDEVIQTGPDRFYRRRRGHPLQPQRMGLAAFAQKLREVGSINFAAQYLQNPLPAHGNIIQREWLHSYPASWDHRKIPGKIVMSIDCGARTGENNDYTVMVIAHVHKREIRVIHVFRRKLVFPNIKRHLIRLAQEWDVTDILIEDQSSGQGLIDELRADSSLQIPWPIKIRPEGDKEARLQGVSGMIEAGQLLLPEEAGWLADFTSELLAFPSGRHDDQVDALSQLLNWVRKGWKSPSS